MLNNTNSWPVSRQEMQQLFLPAILETYITNGYDVQRIVFKHAASVLARNILPDEIVPITLEYVVTEPLNATGLKCGDEYVAQRCSLLPGPRTVGVQYRSIEFDASHFSVGENRIGVVCLDNGKQVEMSFYEFLTAIEKWLPNTKATVASNGIR